MIESNFEVALSQLLDYQANNTGMLIRMINDQIHRSVKIMIRTPHQEVGKRFIIPKIVKVVSDWHYKWWARWIRKACSKKWSHKLIPYPLEALAFAEFITIGYETVELSSSVWDSIVAQIADIKMSGDNPTKILIGHAAMADLSKTLNFNMFSPLHLADRPASCGTIAGIAAEFSNKITPDSVLVV